MPHYALDIEWTRMNDQESMLKIIDAIIGFIKTGKLKHPFLNESRRYKSLAQYIFEAEA